MNLTPFSKECVEYEKTVQTVGLSGQYDIDLYHMTSRLGVK